jgi:hypothetical protein
MSLALLSAGALAALATLAIPLLIHLVRRSAQRPVDFAALRWISARQRPQRRLVLDEKLLLGLRLLVLALVALFLAQPVWREAPSAPAWVAVVPGVELASARALALPEDAEWRWLAPGFPPLGTPPPGPVQVSSLLRELDARLPASARLAVVTPVMLSGVDGERPRLGRPVDWRVAAGAPLPGLDAPSAPRVAIRHADGREDATRYLEAAVRAWNPRQETPRAPDLAATLGLPGANARAGADVLFWLHPGPVPGEVLAWAAAGRTLVLEPGAAFEGAPGSAVVTWRDQDAAPLATAEALGDGRLVRLQHPLEPAHLPAMLQPEFPAMLRSLLQPPAAPAVVPAETHAPLRATWHADGEGLDAAVRPLQPWLALLIAALLLLERWLATRVQRWRP